MNPSMTELPSHGLNNTVYSDNVITHIAKMNKISMNNTREYLAYVHCKLNGIKTQALIDSGNTSMNAISARLAKKILGKRFTNQLSPLNDKIWVFFPLEPTP